MAPTTDDLAAQVAGRVDGLDAEAEASAARGRSARGAPSEVYDGEVDDGEVARAFYDLPMMPYRADVFLVSDDDDASVITTDDDDEEGEFAAAAERAALSARAHAETRSSISRARDAIRRQRAAGFAAEMQTRDTAADAAGAGGEAPGEVARAALSPRAQSALYRVEIMRLRANREELLATQRRRSSIEALRGASQEEASRRDEGEWSFAAGRGAASGAGVGTTVSVRQPQVSASLLHVPLHVPSESCSQFVGLTLAPSLSLTPQTRAVEPVRHPPSFTPSFTTAREALSASMRRAASEGDAPPPFDALRAADGASRRADRGQIPNLDQR